MPPKAKTKAADQIQEVDETHQKMGPKMPWAGEVHSVNATAGRVYHISTLFDGRLFLFGGWNGKTGHLDTASSYEFSTGVWSNVDCLGVSHPGTSQSAAAEVSTGLGGLLFFGGWDGLVRNNETTLLQLENMTWEPFLTNGEKPPALTFHSASYASKRFYVFGGNNAEGQSGEMYMLDLNTMQWSHCASLGAPTKRSSHTATVINDNVIVVFGGRGGTDGSQALNDVSVFDTSNNHWIISVKVEGAPPPRYGHSALAVKNKIVIFGGVGTDGNMLNDVWILEMEKPNQLSWMKIASEGNVPSPRTGHSVLESISGMYVVGGRTDSLATVSSDVYLMDLTPIAPPPVISDNIPDAATTTPGDTPALRRQSSPQSPAPPSNG